MRLSDYVHESLDQIGIAACAYDSKLRAVGWNLTFLAFFPEHHGKISVGEPYAANMRRFYAARRTGDDPELTERYVMDGVARHVSQTQPFEFQHHGRRLKSSSLPAPCGGRLRLWHVVEQPMAADALAGLPSPSVDALRFVPDGGSILDGQDRIMAVNEAFYRLYDMPLDRSVTGLPLEDVIAGCWQDSGRASEMRETLRIGLRHDGAPFEIELPGRRWRRIIARHTRDGIGWFTHADITATKRQQVELTEMRDALARANSDLAMLAGTDSLTGLKNRRSFMATLQTEAARAGSLALLMLDIDLFKAVNDRLGHLGGDATLNLTAERLAVRSAAAGGVCGRLGGEEFGIILPGASFADAEKLAAALHRDLRLAPWERVAPGFSGVTVSIGLSWGQGPLDAGSLHSLADDALYDAKRSGRNRTESRPGPSAVERRDVA